MYMSFSFNFDSTCIYGLKVIDYYIFGNYKRFDLGNIRQKRKLFQYIKNNIGFD